MSSVGCASARHAALLKPALARCMTSAAISSAKGRGIEVKVIYPLICCIGLTLTASVGAAPAGDDFPLTGNYTQNVPCKGDRPSSPSRGRKPWSHFWEPAISWGKGV